jgi:hypothetical protein
MVTVLDCGDGWLAIYVCGGLPQFPQFDLFPHPQKSPLPVAGLGHLGTPINRQAPRRGSG